MGLTALGPGCSCCRFCASSFPTDFADDFNGASLDPLWLGYFTRGDWALVSGHLRYVKSPFWPPFGEPQTQSFLYRRAQVASPSVTVRIGGTLEALRSDTVSIWGYIQRIGVGWSALSPSAGSGLFSSMGLRNDGTFLAAESFQNRDGVASADGSRYVLVTSSGLIPIGGAAPAAGDTLELELSGFRLYGSSAPFLAVCDLVAKINGSTRYSRSPWYYGFPLCEAFVGVYGMEWWTQGSGSAGTRAELDDFFYSGL